MAYPSRKAPLSASLAHRYAPADTADEDNDASLQQARAWDQHAKRRLRRLRVVQRSCNLAASIMVLGVMLDTFLSFVIHKTAKSGDTTISIYPSHPVLWPTYMMIGTASVSILFNGLVVISYFWGIAAANRISSYSKYWGYSIYVVNFGVWLATSTAFKMLQDTSGSQSSDLWGWTCSDLASGIQQEVNNVVNFDLQCTTQLASFAVGLVNAGLELFGIVITIFALRRYMRKRKMRALSDASKVAS